MYDLDRFFRSNVGFFIGEIPVNYRSTDTNEVSRFIENPEWKIKNLEEQIDILNKRDSYYDQQTENIVILKGKLNDRKKELKKELKNLRNSLE